MTDEERPPGAPDPEPRPRRAPVVPRAFYNWISVAGAVLVVGGVAGAIFFSLLDLLTGRTRTYPGVMLIPFMAPALVGLLLVPLGIMRERRRRARGLGPSITTEISIDLARITRRRPFFFLVTFTVTATVIVLGFGYATISAVEFTESNTFCGQVCHTVMNPEYHAFQESPHSRLDCVECHVGAGAEGFLHAKLNGLNQVVSILTGSYPRPIPTPVHDMPNARELCENCHTPDRLIGHVSYGREYFLADEENSPVQLEMLVNVGGKPRNGHGVGIHYHMFLGRKVEYIARDDARQRIAWVRMTRPNGTTVEYEDDVVPLTDEERASLPMHTMDCLDCHNRPAHRFEAPTDAMNEALAGGVISRDLPYVKREAVLALSEEYDTTKDAMAGIEEHLRSFYEEEEPDVLEEQGKALEAAIHQVQAIYRDNIFPEMKARWSSHPDNLGHRDWPGCFRCHNEDMVSEDGDAVFDGCGGCHKVLFQRVFGQEQTASFEEGQPFLHPEDGEPFDDEYTDCTECHDGGALLYE